MKSSRLAALLAAGALAGCMAGEARIPPEAPAATTVRSSSAGSDSAAPPTSVTGRGPANPTDSHGSAVVLGTPLLIDRTDLRLGTTVHFNRVPTVSELYDLSQILGVAHVVLALPEWPSEYAPLEPLRQLPQGADLVVVLQGYPPTRAAAEVWSYLDAPLRIVVVVNGPPPSVSAIADLNSMRSLERVIAQMDYPARTGFERLQRPLSFRKVME